MMAAQIYTIYICILNIWCILVVSAKWEYADKRTKLGESGVALQWKRIQLLLQHIYWEPILGAVLDAQETKIRKE